VSNNKICRGIHIGCYIVRFVTNNPRLGAQYRSIKTHQWQPTLRGSIVEFKIYYFVHKALIIDVNNTQHDNMVNIAKK